VKWYDWCYVIYKLTLYVVFGYSGEFPDYVVACVWDVFNEEVHDKVANEYDFKEILLPVGACISGWLKRNNYHIIIALKDADKTDQKPFHLIQSTRLTYDHTI
jgi:hypothetical protein